MITGSAKILTYGSPVNRQSPLNKGLLSWWRMSTQGGSKRAVDLCGLTHGTSNGGVSVAGKGYSAKPGAWKFNGTSGTLNMGVPTRLDLGLNTTTISAWARFSSFSKANVIVSRWGAQGGREFIIYCTTTPQIVVIMQQSNNATIVIINNSNVPVVNQWCFVCFNYVPNGTCTLTVDGVAVTGAASGTPAISPASFRIGSSAEVSEAGGNWMNGDIDDVRYSRGNISASQLRSAGRTGYQRELNWLTRWPVGTSGAPTGTTYPQLERQLRGVNRGVYSGH